MKQKLSEMGDDTWGRYMLCDKKKKREREAEIVNISVTGNILKRSSLGRELG